MLQEGGQSAELAGAWNGHAAYVLVLKLSAVARGGTVGTARSRIARIASVGR